MAAKEATIRRGPVRPIHARASATLAVCAALCPPPAAGASGELLREAALPAAGADVAANPEGTRIWVISETSGEVFVLGPALTPIDAIPHPFGPAAFPFLVPRVRGVAYAPDRGTLFALNATDRAIREFAADGTPAGPPVALDLPDGLGDTLWSLAYDPAGGRLWTVDDETDRLIEVDPETGRATRVLPFPGDDPPETRLHGHAVAVAPGSRLVIAYGTILDPRPVRARFLDPEGQPTGREVPLDAVGPGVMGGIAWLRAGGAERLLVLTGEGALRGTLHEIDATPPPLLPPTDLRAALTLDGRVILAWVNHGSGAVGAYGEIVLRIHGEIAATIGGSSMRWIAPAGAAGPVTFGVQGKEGLILSPVAAYATRVGPGGIVRWRPFPGAQASGIAHDPATGAIWASDAAGDRICRFDRRLEREGSFASPFAGGTGPIAFLAAGADGAPCLLAAARDGPRIARITPEGEPLEAPRALGLSDPAAILTGLAPGPDGSVLALEAPAGRLLRMTAEGALLAACAPRLPGGIALGEGIASSADPEFVHVTTADGSIAELALASCSAAGRFVHPVIQADAAGGDRVRGIARAGDVLLACGGATNAIYEIVLRLDPAAFVRGDANDDARVDVADGVAIAAYLFRSGPPPPCTDAADANDDGRIDISDPIFVVWYLFAGGPPPPAPFPAAGGDPTGADGLECER